MQHVVIIGVGKLREKFFRDAAEEYKKRLSRYVKLDIVEVDDLPEDAGDATKKKEGEMILSKISSNLLVPTRQGVHLPQDSSTVKSRKKRAMSTIQLSSSITIRPPEPIIEPIAIRLS